MQRPTATTADNCDRRVGDSERFKKDREYYGLLITSDKVKVCISVVPRQIK